MLYTMGNRVSLLLVCRIFNSSYSNMMNKDKYSSFMFLEKKYEDSSGEIES